MNDRTRWLQGKARPWVNDHPWVTTGLLLLLLLTTSRYWTPSVPPTVEWIEGHPGLIGALATIGLVGFAAVELMRIRSDRRGRERAANIQIGAEAHSLSVELAWRIIPMLKKNHKSEDYRKVLEEVRPRIMNMVRLGGDASPSVTDVLLRAYVGYSQLYIGAGMVTKEGYEEILREMLAALDALSPKTLLEAWGKVGQRLFQEQQKNNELILQQEQDREQPSPTVEPESKGHT